MTACCSSCDLSAKLMLDAIKSTRKEPSLSITTPSRTSLMGTNAWVASALILGLVAGISIKSQVSNLKSRTFYACYAQLRAVFDVERPGQVFELALGEFWDRQVLGFGRCGLLRLGVPLHPQVELGAKEVAERVLHGKDERPAVDRVECESRRERRDRNPQNNREVEGQEGKKQEDKPAAAGQIDKLFERQRPKYLVFYLDKLRNLVLCHYYKYIVSFIPVSLYRDRLCTVAPCPS